MLTLHHLECSRSSRIIWLLEALALPYRLVLHRREHGRRAPEALGQVHPLGKAPVIVDGALVLAESSAILRTIAERYGDGRFMPAAGSDDAARHAAWLDFAEGSLMTPLMIRLLGGGVALPPGLAHYATTQLDRALLFLAEGVSPGPFLMGAQVTIADMQMSYCMALLEFSGCLSDHPALQCYWGALQADSGFRRMLEVGGPLVPMRG